MGERGEIAKKITRQRGEIEKSEGREDFLKEVKRRANMEEEVVEGEITLEELRFVLEKTKKDKSPGVDSIPYEFYESFFKEIGKTMIAMMRTLL